ncbi:MAG: DUF262 domain-containing protein [Nitrospirae bacterium]|nr:DUF262 domain-containing protein [Nitrospirota bacterium]
MKQELGADGKLTGVEADEDVEIKEPFDPESISIEARLVSVDNLIRRLIKGTIRLATPFQRNEVWDRTRQSRLIESLMLKIPLPTFYVSADRKENWDVVDGLQRISTIKEFVLGNEFMETRDDSKRGEGFLLEDLEFLGDRCNKKIFKDLPGKLQDNILDTEFRFTQINPGTPEDVKRNIFKRINTGGMPLTAQEIRHALYEGKSSKLMSELVTSSEFKESTGGGVDDSRMAARELVLRFLAFSVHNYENYSKKHNMDEFLCDTMRIINIMPELNEKDLKAIFKDRPVRPIPQIICKDINILRKRFLDGMTRAFKLFGEHTFRKSYKERRQSPINKTLFEVWGNVLADLDNTQFDMLINKKDSFLEDYRSILDTPWFPNFISRYGSLYTQVQERYHLFKDLLRTYTC